MEQHSIDRNRLEAFTDAVIAIAMTVLILDMVPPNGDTFMDLWSMRYKFVVYIISFSAYIIYWKNHHHLFTGVKRISHKAIWLNAIMLFFLTLFNFAISWMDAHISGAAPEILYGVVMLGANVSFVLLARQIEILNDGMPHTRLNRFRVWFTILLNIAAICLAFFWPPIMFISMIILLIFWASNYFNHSHNHTAKFHKQLNSFPDQDH